jgi:hypothetical protein
VHPEKADKIMQPFLMQCVKCRLRLIRLSSRYYSRKQLQLIKGLETGEAVQERVKDGMYGIKNLHGR